MERDVEMAEIQRVNERGRAGEKEMVQLAPCISMITLVKIKIYKDSRNV
jgi:hypothetical protein